MLLLVKTIEKPEKDFVTKSTYLCKYSFTQLTRFLSWKIKQISWIKLEPKLQCPEVLTSVISILWIVDLLQVLTKTIKIKIWVRRLIEHSATTSDNQLAAKRFWNKSESVKDFLLPANAKLSAEFY